MMAEFSLLWPGPQPTPTWHISQETIRDLELEVIAQAMCTHSSYREAVRTVLFQLCLDPETIHFWQIVLSDLQSQPMLADKIEALLPLLDELTQFTYRNIGRKNKLQEVVVRARVGTDGGNGTAAYRSKFPGGNCAA